MRLRPHRKNDEPEPTMTTALTSATTQPQPAQATARFDMYADIHKAIRCFMTDTLLRVGQLDLHDEAEVARTLDQLDELLVEMSSHLKRENAFVHPAMEARLPGTSTRIAVDHAEHIDAIEQLEAESRSLRQMPSGQRAVPAQRLYRHLALFVADNLQHMHVEETAHNAALWSAYGDDELMALHGAILQSLHPAEVEATLRWMARSLNPHELAEVLLGVRAGVPPEAFLGLLDIVRPQLDDWRWAKLTRALGLPQVPGLVEMC
jgi:hypothetical protein